MKREESILIVDDDESTRASLARILGKKGYKTDTAETGRQALEKARERFYNLALLDIRLPDLEGVELLRPLKETHPDMVLIMVTGHATMENAVRALNDGASAYATKPMDMDAVLAMIGETLEKQRLIWENRWLLEEVRRELDERKRAEEALRRERDNLVNILEAMEDGVYIVGPQYDIEYVNEPLQRTFGPADGKKCYEHFYDRQEPCTWCKNDQVLAGETVRWEWYSFRDQKMYDLFETPLRNPDGSTSKLAMLRDITKRKHMEEELLRHRYDLEELVSERTIELRRANERLRQEIHERTRMERTIKESEERFRAIAEATPIPLVIARLSDGQILYANKHFGPAFDLRPDDVVGRKAPDYYFDPADRQRLLDTLQADGHIHGLEVRFKKADGTPFWAIASMQPLTFNGEPAILSGFNEITAHKEMELKLQELYEHEKELRHSLEEEMRKRMEFTRALAHELKTPLTPVMMSSQALESRLTEEPLASLARNVSRGAANLNARIDELLDLAKGEVGMLRLQAKSVDMRQLLEEAIEDASSLASSREQSLIAELPPSLPRVRADEVRSRQIVMNLLNNALKFTPEGGKVTVRAREEDDSLVVEVQDTGPGIPKEEQQRVFDPYQRREGVDERLSGLGLGLALCKSLVDLHGGQIWVESHPGKGSTFGFSLPLEAHK